ncbi:MAG: ribosomal protein S18-alanine N-acetyltransferase [Eubacteriales bacterium]|nr:ribosomal protein S18-alanine N-acetyltransferase [Eubacteriales bacterium]
MEYEAVPASRNDLEEIARIENLCFSLPHSLEQLERELEDKTGMILCVHSEDVPIGYITMKYVLDEGYIGNVAVAPEFRRKGIAALLLSEQIKRAQELGLSFLTLEVRETNAPAISLYEKFDFKIVGKQKNYYTAPKENAIIMTLMLE